MICKQCSEQLFRDESLLSDNEEGEEPEPEEPEPERTEEKTEEILKREIDVSKSEEIRKRRK